MLVRGLYVILLFFDEVFESHQCPENAYTEHNVTKAGDAGDGCSCTTCKWGAEHLSDASYEEHDAGHVKADIVENKELAVHQLVVGHSAF